MFGGVVEPQETDVSKKHAANKYQKRLKAKRHQVQREKNAANNAYEDLVEEIRLMRLKKKSKKQIARKVETLEKVKKQKKRLKRIAHAMAGSPNYVEKYGVPMLDMLNSLIETAKSAREYVGEQTVKFLIDLFMTMYNMYKNPTWDGVVLNMTSFFVRHFKANYADIALDWFKSAFEIVTTQDDKFSYQDYILSFFKGTDEFMNDMLWTKISEFFSKIMVLYAASDQLISVETFDFPTICLMFQEFRKTLPDITDIIEMAFEAFRFVTGHWANICTGKWGQMLLGKEESKTFEIEVRELEQAYSFVLSGQEIELRNVYNMTLDTYESRLKKALETAKKLILRCKSAQQRMSVSNFVRKLSDMQANIWARKADAPAKEEAYAIKMAGPSSCGKSTMVKLMSKTVLNSYNRDTSETGNIVFTNIDENYESTIEPSHKIIVADDVANNRNSKPNYDRLLNYVNTVPRPLEKAEADKKGKYYPGNDALIVTTNDESIRAVECSVCPESILRRFAIDIGVEIREPFRNSFGGLVKQDTLRFDVYRLTLKRFSHIEPQPDGRNIVIWDVIPRSEWNHFDDDEHDFHAMCSFLVKDVKRHRRRQNTQMEMQKTLDDCGFCHKCGNPEVVCSCIPVTPDDVEVEAVAMASPLSIWQSMSTQELWDIRYSLSSVRGAFRKTFATLKLCKKLHEDKRVYAGAIAVIITSALLSTLIGARATQTLTMTAIAVVGYRYVAAIRAIDAELDRRSDQLSSLCSDISEHLENNSRKYFAVSGAVFFAYGLYKALKPFIYRTQDKGTYLDKTLKHFEKNLDCPKKGQFVLDIQDQRDYKEGYSRLPPKDTAISKTTTSKDLQLSIARSLRVVVIKSKGEIYGTVNGIMVASNVIMVPAHVIPYTFPFDIETTTTPGVPSAKTKDQKLTEEFCYTDRENDQAFVHLASSPASTSYVDFFPEEYPQFYSRSTVMLWKSPENEIKVSRHASRPLEKDLTYGGFLEHPGWLYGQRQKFTLLTLSKGKGLTYESEFKGFGGLCGGVVMDAEKGIIYGFHVAGIPNSYRGWSTCVLRRQIVHALAELDRKSPTLVVHSANEVKVDTYGQPYSIQNSKPLYLREDGVGDNTVVSYFGKVLKDGQEMESRARTPYMRTVFKGVSENLGECKHRPPQKPNDVSRTMKTLNKLHNPVQHYEGDILSKAIEDYANHTLETIRKDPEMKDVLRIYSQEEAMDGIGKFGLGGLPNDTSAGFPIMKSKKHCLKRDPLDESLVQVPREFNDNFDVQSEVDRTLDCWQNGLRSEAIYKASSKVNELLPEKKAKEKVRKFYGSSFANFVASRRVLAGVPQFMKKHWKTTECLVGINPLSIEWDEFHTYLTEYSTTNMIAGDFSGFDTRMAAQITGAAAQIIIRWYEEAGVSEEDLKLIKGALSDIIHPNILIDGDLYRFANGNPSGNLITVQLNSICNSIMMRYVYYAMMPNIRESFATNVRLGTYGDDNAMSVKHHCRWYTHTACQKEFEKLDIGYTMADKDAKSRPYIGIDEISFLKRSFAKHETLNVIVGPIEEDSTLKRFHWLKKPGDTPLSFTEQFGAYTDGALRDYYLRGRIAYNDFLTKLQNIVDLNPELKGVVYFFSYDEMTEVLRHYYSKDYVNKNEKLFAESAGYEFEEEHNRDASPLTGANVQDSCMSMKTENIIGCLCVALYAMTLTEAMFPGFTAEQWKKFQAKMKQLYNDYIVTKKDGLSEAYSLNGAAGVAELLGLPTTLVCKILSLVGL